MRPHDVEDPIGGAHGPTWSVLEPSGVVTRFQGAALADDAVQTDSSMAGAAA